MQVYFTESPIIAIVKMLQVFQRAAQMTGLNAALSIARAIKPPVTKDMQYTGAGESMHWFKLHKQNFLSLSYTELTFLMELTNSFLSWRNQTAPPWESSTGIVTKAACESEKPVSVLPAPTHTDIFNPALAQALFWELLLSWAMQYI